MILPLSAVSAATLPATPPPPLPPPPLLWQELGLDRTLEQALPELVLLRRHLHRHPELSGHEQQTAALVAGELRRWGWQVQEGVGRTGVLPETGGATGIVRSAASRSSGGAPAGVEAPTSRHFGQRPAGKEAGITMAQAGQMRVFEEGMLTQGFR